MIRVNYISSDEKQILKHCYQNARCRLIRERAHAVILSGQGKSVPDIALILLRNEHTVRKWVNTFSEWRISSIFHEYEGNTNASKLTKEQREEIKETLGKPPSELGLSKEFWDVRMLKKYLKAEFGVVYESDRSYHYLLQFTGLSFKLPSLFDVKRDKDLINRRLAEIREEIKPYLSNNRWEVFAADETRMTWEAEIRRAWLKKGEKTVIKVHRDDQYQSFFGALNLKKHYGHTFKVAWQNQEEIIRVLRKLLARYRGKRICLIWDGARWHKGKELRQELRKGKSLSRLHLINFPPYAPDVNPQEKIWNYGKERVSNDSMPGSFLEAIRLFTNSTQGKSFDYKIPEFVLR